MLKRLKQDHKHIAMLLKILRNKHQRLLNGDFVNFNLVRDIVEYMQGYAEHSHHPMEDIIYEYYASKSAHSEQTSSRLLDEHKQLVEASASLMVSLNAILSDIIVAKEKLTTELDEYISLQTRHMEYEEHDVFPKLVAGLDDNDWRNINEMSVQKLVDDPLFSENDNQLFEELRRYIAETE